MVRGPAAYHAPSRGIGIIPNDSMSCSAVRMNLDVLRGLGGKTAALTGVGEHLTGVDRGVAPMVHDQVPIDENAAHVAAPGGKHEEGGEVVGGGEVGLVEVEKDQIGAFADLDAADEVAEPEGPGALDGGRLHDGARRCGRGVGAREPGQERGLAHRGPEVEVVGGGAAVGAQTEADAARLRELGAGDIAITGNVKFDVSPPPDTTAKAAELKALFAGRFVFLCASTREGEEALLLEALGNLPADVLLVLVPRHPQRFDAVADLIRTRGLAFARRSEGQAPGPGARVFLGDSMGEMAAYYAAADLCYVGGSLLPLGGQNMIEAAAAGCPALFGPHTWNFLEAADQAVACGAARRVADGAALRTALLELRNDAEARRRMAEAGLAFTRANRGATGKVLSLIEAAQSASPALPDMQGRG